MQAKLRQLKNVLAEIWDLTKIRHVISWDQHTVMPPGGAAMRAEQLATINRIAHEMFISEDVGRLLDELRPYEDSLPYESDDASLIRVVRNDWERARRVPAELEAELTRAASVGMEAWVEARKQSNYGLFLPHLRRNVELKHRYIECFEPEDHFYDVLLYDYEQGMTTAEVKAIFEELKEGLVPLVAAASPDGGAARVAGTFPAKEQEQFSLDIIRRFGFDTTTWRLDPTVHPFATSGCTTDIRLTTRYREDDLSSLFTAMHEFGHGLYERQISPTLERTPLCRGVSMALHESQSRMWENLVGRSRPFWRFFYPRLQEKFDALRSVDADEFYAAINRVQPSLIRVDADEVTYNLHIILRFELELEIMGGELTLEDLPEAWTARMSDYLGVNVPDDARGVLQDIHWSGGSLGYFPTYSLGNVVSVQIWERALEAMPDLYEQFETGEFSGLREWLGRNVHTHGRKFAPKETLAKVVGGPIDAKPYLRYLQGKLGESSEIAAATR